MWGGSRRTLSEGEENFFFFYKAKINMQIENMRGAKVERESSRVCFLVFSISKKRRSLKRGWM